MFSCVPVVQVDGMTIVVEDIVGSTGLELKVDPGVPYVYAGFAGQSLLSVIFHLLFVPHCCTVYGGLAFARLGVLDCMLTTCCAQGS